LKFYNELPPSLRWQRYGVFLKYQNNLTV